MPLQEAIKSRTKPTEVDEERKKERKKKTQKQTKYLVSTIKNRLNFVHFPKEKKVVESLQILIVDLVASNWSSLYTQ